MKKMVLGLFILFAGVVIGNITIDTEFSLILFLSGIGIGILGMGLLLIGIYEEDKKNERDKV